MNAVWQYLEKWWQRPFDPNGDAVNWLLFVGLLLVAAFAWSRVLAHIEE